MMLTWHVVKDGKTICKFKDEERAREWLDKQKTEGYFAACKIVEVRTI